MSYGLQIFNAQGQMMFDSLKRMSSYVVRSYGTATSVDVSVHDILFVKPVDGDLGGENNYRRYTVEPSTPSTATTQTFNFYYNNPNFTTSKFQATLDYFIITPSRYITPADEDYALVINNEDESLQFDTRTILTDKHFQIINSYSYPDVGGNGNGTSVCNAALNGSSDEYLSVTHFATNPAWPAMWTYYDNSIDTGNYQIASFRTRSTLQTIAVNEADVETDEEEDPFFPSVYQFFPRIESQILIGKLI